MSEWIDAKVKLPEHGRCVIAFTGYTNVGFPIFFTAMYSTFNGWWYRCGDGTVVVDDVIYWKPLTKDMIPDNEFIGER